MIDKMKLLHITGPKEDIDRVVDLYLTKYEIHFENAMSSLPSVSNVRPFAESNVHKETLLKSEAIMEHLPPGDFSGCSKMPPQAAEEIVEKAYDEISSLLEQEKEVDRKRIVTLEFVNEIEPFQGLDYEFRKILDFKFIHFRFGKVARAHYNKLSRYIYETEYTVFYECNSDEDYVWGVYFAPAVYAVEVDAMYTSFQFEQVYITDRFDGTLESAYEKAQQRLEELAGEKEELEQQLKMLLDNQKENLYIAYHALDVYCRNFDIRKLAVCTKEKADGQIYYILYGWMNEIDTLKFKEDIKDDQKIRCVDENVDANLTTIPPTRLKNPKIFKPFEMFIEMYGLPAYNEIDPTIFVGLTYTFMFGMMFGDVGQGLCLVILGVLLYKIKGMNLGGILSIAGVWSVIFGFLYGSIFGFEDVLPALWMRPMESITKTLLLSVLFGVILILIAMVINIMNGIRAKNIEKIWFDPSGVAGFVGYSAILVCILLVFLGYSLPATVILVVVIGIPFLAILLKEPLTHFIEKKSTLFPKGSKVMFFIEAFVELFDVILSYATNTISFVRVGAFALSHAGMMGVVFTLAGMEKGSPNLFIVIVGNIVVMALEGLVVGIQVLRLEYYEMFSRFYRGTGKEFKPFSKMVQTQKQTDAGGKKS